MTYSIVPRDPKSGEMGVAVQTDWFAVGNVVTWAEPGVGAVATQSFAEVSYGPLGLDLMRGGKTAPEALRALLAGDSGEAMRQVGMVDTSGRIAAHTGTACVEAAGNVAGDGVTVQANMMERDTVWGAMLEAFQESDERLAERLVAALVEVPVRAGEGSLRALSSEHLELLRRELPLPLLFGLRDLDHHVPPSNGSERAATTL